MKREGEPNRHPGAHLVLDSAQSRVFVFGHYHPCAVYPGPGL